MTITQSTTYKVHKHMNEERKQHILRVSSLWCR